MPTRFCAETLDPVHRRAGRTQLRRHRVAGLGGVAVRFDRAGRERPVTRFRVAQRHRAGLQHQVTEQEAVEGAIGEQHLLVGEALAGQIGQPSSGSPPGSGRVRGRRVTLCAAPSYGARCSCCGAGCKLWFRDRPWAWGLVFLVVTVVVAVATVVVRALTVTKIWGLFHGHGLSRLACGPSTCRFPASVAVAVAKAGTGGPRPCAHRPTHMRDRCPGSTLAFICATCSARRASGRAASCRSSDWRRRRVTPRRPRRSVSENQLLCAPARSTRRRRGRRG